MEAVSPPVQETWNLEDLFADDATFEAERRKFSEGLPELDRLRGRLGESAATLATALGEISDAAKQFGKLRCYASLKSDTDTRVDHYQAMRQGIDLLATEFSRRTSYVRPEILEIDPERIEAFIGEEPRLSPHAHFLRDLMRIRQHVLGASEEKILAEAGLVTQTPSSLYLVLNNVELPRPEITLHTGEQVSLTPVNFHRHRSSSHRDDRQRLFPAYFSAYSGFKDTFGQNLYGMVKAHTFRARVRGHASSLAAALNPENVPTAVYRNLIEQVRAKLGVLHRYFRLRARRLGLERLEYPDLYCPLSDAPAERYQPAEATRLVAESLVPLGKSYVSALENAFGARWIDWHATPGKRAGAYATGWAYDVHPYVLLNYLGDFDSVSTLAHEMGHAMHSHFSNKQQPFPTADYSIFVAEVASTVNEALLIRRMLAEAEEPTRRLALVTSYLDGIRGTLFRQTMFAEFELEMHERVDRGDVLTGETLNAIYLELLRTYHGHDDGIVHIDDAYAIEWATIPHFYYNFYVYQYSTGIVAAQALARALTDPDENAATAAQARYLEFLGSGGSDYPLAVLRRAGVDLESAKPYDAAFTAIDQLLDELEAL